MRSSLGLIAVLTVAFMAPNSAWAQENVSGRFSVSFEKVVNNCPVSNLELGGGSLTITTKGKVVEVKQAKIPLMSGPVGRRGKIRVDAQGPINPEGVHARFGLNGRISDNKLKGVFVAEYFKGEKPQCTQSWTVTGSRKK